MTSRRRAAGTALITHDDCFAHKMPEGHPECAARLDAVLNALEGKELIRCDAPLVKDGDLAPLHPQAHLDRLEAMVPERGGISIDGDTWMSPGTMRAARRGAGGAILGVQMVMAGQAQNAFVATRPPGHHAEASQAMGFCFLCGAAVAARHALDHHGLARVAIIDFDVHHGNGTQALTEDDPRIMYLSAHQMPLFPGTGDPSETGADGTVVNVALRDGSGSAAFRAAMSDVILPAAAAFRPELLIVSAGFDAHRADPLAGLMLDTADFTWISEALCDLAGEHCEGRLVSVLEGGYDLNALATCAAAHVDVLIARSRA
ncbi:Acetoin utilization deacetylase AcuC [Roseovarius nanhaiticus]|uniref:Acetoin utilization deacetylase AcuC n=1 Tax=Roseovarius nanhaiticus TaxID=573024 RepID=A0A1N7EQQ4_9RHOB|nr:histone deacetylase family protein [Roseovarius nanhaiticus]SEK68696.1 Acetoin utilization deacetylase AcuC [Roseovarius nanhaiticus]SIR90433.1 Acetoin utilization deacetylase AcuC [Roseovarius nanhaiticus]